MFTYNPIITFGSPWVTSCGMSAAQGDWGCVNDAINNFGNAWFFFEGMRGGGEEEAQETEQAAIKATSQNQMQRQVERGQAPRGVDRVDKPHVPGQQPHVHY
jgi:hypothetical protein